MKTRRKQRKTDRLFVGRLYDEVMVSRRFVFSFFFLYAFFAGVGAWVWAATIPMYSHGKYVLVALAPRLPEIETE